MKAGYNLTGFIGGYWPYYNSQAWLHQGSDLPPEVIPAPAGQISQVDRQGAAPSGGRTLQDRREGVQGAQGGDRQVGRMY